MKTLHLPMQRRWFDLTAQGIKTEDYREIKPFWISRLLKPHPPSVIAGGDYRDPHTGIIYSFRDFDTVTEKNGYGKNAPVAVYKCAGIHIGTGNPDWGAEPGKQYFVIRLGEGLS